MSWQDYYRRRRIIDGVLADVTRTGWAVIPADWHQPIIEIFGDEESFLAALGYRWLNTLTARLDQVCEDQPADVDAAVHRARHALATEQPTLAALLTAYADKPALVTARTTERQRCEWVEQTSRDRQIPPTRHSPRDRQPVFPGEGSS